MSFLTGALRVVGTVAAAALASTGVGIPAAVGIGAAATAAGNFGADAIEAAEARRRADEAAEAQRRAAEAELQRRRAEDEARARAIQEELNRRLAHEALPRNVLEACRTGQVDGIPNLLQQMDNDQFNQLGLTPLAECSSAEAQERVLSMLEAERSRRGL